jgi:hypothetical protein
MRRYASSQPIDHTPSKAGSGARFICRGSSDLRRIPLSDRKAMLRKLLSRSKGGIQYVEHAEGDGAELFAHACKLGPGRNRFEAAYRGVQIGTGQKLDQDAQSEVARLPADH